MQPLPSPWPLSVQLPLELNLKLVRMTDAGSECCSVCLFLSLLYYAYRPGTGQASSRSTIIFIASDLLICIVAEFQVTGILARLRIFLGNITIVLPTDFHLLQCPCHRRPATPDIPRIQEILLHLILLCPRLALDVSPQSISCRLADPRPSPRLYLAWLGMITKVDDVFDDTIDGSKMYSFACCDFGDSEPTLEIILDAVSL